MKEKQILQIEFEVYYWDDNEDIVYTDGGSFYYSEVVPNSDYTKVVVYYD